MQVTDVEGREGWGEAAPLPGWGVGSIDEIEAWVTEVGAGLVGHSPVARSLWLDPSGSYPPEGPPGASSALGVALYDLQGRQSGRSMAEVLLDDMRSSVGTTSGFGSVNPTVPVNALIGAGSIEDSVAAAEAAIEAGFATLKCKVGAASVASDAERLLAIAAAGDVALRVDANGAWTVDQALEFEARVDGLVLEWIEDPVPAALATEVGPRLASRVATEWKDRSTWDLVDAGAVDVVVAKLPVHGGPLPLLLMADTAATKGAEVVVTSFLGSTIGIAAALQTAAALGPGIPACGLATAELLASDFAEPLPITNGTMALPAEPGLGVTPTVHE